MRPLKDWPSWNDFHDIILETTLRRLDLTGHHNLHQKPDEKLPTKHSSF